MKTILMALAATLGFGGAAVACPNYNITAAEQFNGNGSQLRSPAFYDVIAGGDNYIWNCPGINPQSDRGAGYFPSQPDFRFQLSGMSGLRLEISVVSDCDAALLINTGSATWYYDDDDNRRSPLDPSIMLTRPANGFIDIWVGTYDGEYCNAQLRMETFSR